MHLERQVSPFEVLQGRSLGTVFVAMVGVLASLPFALVIEGPFVFPIGMICGSLIGITMMRFRMRSQTERNGPTDLTGYVRNGSKLAVLDPRSGLLQRWYLDLRLAEESERCRRHGLTMTMVFIKLAAPPRSSDERDGALVEEGQLFVNSLRKGDLASRIAPNNYTLCLMHADEWQARSAARRVIGGLRHKQAVEVRLAVCPLDGMDVDSLYRVARPIDVNEQLEPPDRLEDRHPQQSLPKLLASRASGEMPIRAQETASQAKARLRRASRRAGITLNVWQQDNVLRFERVQKQASA